VNDPRHAVVIGHDGNAGYDRQSTGAGQKGEHFQHRAAAPSNSVENSDPNGSVTDSSQAYEARDQGFRKMPDPLQSCNMGCSSDHGVVTQPPAETPIVT
jgi:hypothetical protein